MANKTQIFNLALTLLGRSSISDPDGTGEAEQAMRQVYTLCRQSLLEEHPWNFAIKRVSLAQDTTAPEFEYSYSYEKPADILRIIKLYNNVDPFREEGTKILSNATTMKLLYVYDVEDTTLYSPLFTQVLAHDMAIAAEKRVTGETAMAVKLMEKRRKLLIKAKTVDAQKDAQQRKIKSNRQLAIYSSIDTTK